MSGCPGSKGHGRTPYGGDRPPPGDVNGYCRQAQCMHGTAPQQLTPYPDVSWFTTTSLASLVRERPHFPTCPLGQSVKANKRVWYSAPFFTHPGGYKMCLQVYPDGYGLGEGRYLSAFACMMIGEMDNALKWPFTGEVRFSLHNQVWDSNH